MSLSTSPGAHPTFTASLDLLSAWIEGQMAYNGLPGLAVGIGYDQTLLWQHGFGYADRTQGTPITSRTLFRIASVTKLFTATAILQLRDQGGLQLDDPITKHLPNFTIQQRYPTAPPITIRHLLTHTAGLPREADFPYWTNNAFPSWAEIEERLPAQETAWPTVHKWKYSNLGLTLAGEIVAQVSGQPYTAYIREQILDPLGMADTFVATVPADHELLAVGYGRRMPDGQRALAPHSDCNGIIPAANLASNVADLARFAMLHLRNDPATNALDKPDQILHPNTISEMQRIHWLQEDWQAGWGLGFHIWRYKNQTLVGHGGALRGYRTQLVLCPAQKAFAIVLTNADDGNPGLYIEKIVDWVFPALAEAVKASTAKIDPATWQPYLGRYRNDWGDAQVLVHKAQLIVIDPSQPDPMAGHLRLVPVAEHTFRIESDNGYSAHGELAQFELDAHGKVVQVKLGAGYSQLVAQW